MDSFEPWEMSTDNEGRRDIALGATSKGSQIRDGMHLVG
jgi:hypothetical protein